jgi:hypothetical protein
VEAVLSWRGGEHRWRWEGDVPADACARVGTLAVVLPDAPGPCTLALALEAPGVHARGTDTCTIRAGRDL